MSKLANLFTKCQTEKRLAFIPFVVLQDPDYATSLEICKTLVANGADALELGFAFSDPLLDGDVIQQANNRALGNNATVSKNFTLLKELRELYPTLPLSLLLCSNLIVQRGINNFYQEAKAAGVDAILVADIPLFCVQEFYTAAQKHSIEHIIICPPNVDQEHLAEIAKYAQGFVYMVSRAGVTSAQDNSISNNFAQIVKELKILTNVPLVRGFGVSSPEHVQESKELGVQGVISGSKTVLHIVTNLDNKENMLAALTTFTQKMCAATK